MAHAKEFEFEFFGPHGPALLVFVLPAVVYGLVFGCNAHSCLTLYPQFKLPGLDPSSKLFTTEALLAYIAWFGAVLLLHVLLPGKRAQGVVLPDGARLNYKLNGKHIVVSVVYGR